MMRRETAYKLAGRKHLHADVLAEVQCEHVIRFAPESVGRINEALDWLQSQPYMNASASAYEDSLRVVYDLAHYSLLQIEHELGGRGFVLDDSLLSRLKRSLTHFAESTRMRNAMAPQRLIKQSNQVYVQAWEHHPHGDHDDTPKELRVDK